MLPSSKKLLPISLTWRTNRKRGQGISTDQSLPAAYFPRSQVSRLEARLLCYAGEHARADLLAIMESEYKIRPIISAKDAMRSAFAFRGPSDAVERGKDAGGLCRGPLAHAAENRMDR